MKYIAYSPTNGCSPFTGYGKNEFGIARGLLMNGIDFDNSSALLLLVGFATWLDQPQYTDYRRWLYTMSESTKVSPEWVKAINGYAERVLVPCPDLISIYRKCGVNVPIHLAGHGVDMSPPEYRQRVRPTDRPFTFLSYSLGDQRKGVELAIIAFARLYQNNPNYKLVIKVGKEYSWLDGCREPNIEIVKGSISERRWHDMLYNAHAFLFPSRAEGWGMPPREAALSGMPAIATKFLGMWDVECWGLPLNISHYSPAFYDEWEANGEGGLWAEPSVDHLMYQMQWVVEYYEVATAIAQHGRDYLLQNWSYKHIGSRLKELIDTYA